MDPITAAIIAALEANVASGLTEANKTAITDAYNQLKNLLTAKYGTKSDVILIIDTLETKPASAGQQETLQEEITTINAEQDTEVLTAAHHLLTLVQIVRAKWPGKPI